ncbi:E3 ubiquitin-protein ligase TRIM35-like [Engraulis encrasicolus]|uniref:E3 ubiquitin-protein ligase TRIM35-like n=1 Tax=Engraulis encrasicolus TaxID=184585 RepID=UPI002FD1B115
MPLCYECGESDAHHRHRLQPHEQALQDCREEVHQSMQPIFQSFKTLSKMQKAGKQMAKHIPDQSAQTESQIRKQFEELRAFLKQEEENRLAAVREEFQRKARAQREAAEQLRSEACTLLHALKAGNMDMDMPGEDNVHFLQNYKTSVKRVWKAEQNPNPMKGKRYNSLIEMPKHVSNLRFRVWEKMQTICPYTPVTLDPNTAGPFLHVSDDLTRVRDSGFDIDAEEPVTDDDDAAGLPDNPERFSVCGEMLGHIEGEGRHGDGDTTSWVVDVSDNSNWMVGVARSSVSRKSLVSACPDNGCWALSLRRFRYEALEAPAVTLPLVAMGSSSKSPGTVSTHSMLAKGTPGPQRVKVRVSRETGRVCFTDADRHTHLYTFSPSQSSSPSSSSSTSSPDGEVFLPYFATSCQHCPLTVLPATVTVTTSLLPGPGGRLEEEEEDEEVEDEDDEEEEEEEVEEEEKERHTKMYDGQSKLSGRKPHSVLNYLRIPESQQKHLTHTEL